MRSHAALILWLGLGACQGDLTQPTASEAAAEAAIAAADDRGQSAAHEARKATKRASLKGCAVGAMSVEQDLSGLNVRSGPSENSPVVGILHSLIETDPHAPGDPPSPEDKAIGPSFTITAIDGLWLKIADIDPLVEGYDPDVQRSAQKRNFQGSGWVHRSRVAVDIDFYSNAYDKPYSEPGKWTVIDKNAGDLLALTGGKQGYTADILACERDWLRLRYTRLNSLGQSRQMTGWFNLRPHFIGPHICKPDGLDCLLRQNLDIWDGGV